MTDRRNLPALVHVVGRKNHGKTTLIVHLIAELKRRRLCVGTLKHCGHVYELDTVGKDSQRHRTAGADPTAVVSGNVVAVYRHLEPHADAYAVLADVYAACDIVFLEGNLNRAGRKLEVYRAAAGGLPLASS